MRRSEAVALFAVAILLAVTALVWLFGPLAMLASSIVLFLTAMFTEMRV